MSNLIKLDINSRKVISKNQLINLRGGVRYHCTCIDSVGEWYGNYADQESADDAASIWCASTIADCYPEPV